MTTKWERLRATLDVKDPRGGPDLPADAALDEFERAHDVRLPEDYRAFVKTFGPGELAGVVRVYAPVGRGKPGDLATFADGFRKAADFLGEAFGDPALMRRAVPFANTVFGDMIVWDPKTSGGGHEHPILLLPDDKSRVVKLAPDFDTFVTGRCLSPEFGKYIDDPAFKPDQTFVSFGALSPAGR